jgi:UDP-N-acetylglucosamine diphosphorylase / glucose-1-phosphate thymidylyltransferase / UDP-N-acetylgalactosamine diphosphorylase / glucosamine-1-phosphate N-acetyltransferase / galactosamine-1-phosphate N-acetyltransferase
MNILIPMAGLGSRFPSQQYSMPKPLIDIAGEYMISKVIKSLDLDGKYFFIIAKNKFTDLAKEAILDIKKDSVFIEIDYITEGPAVSALMFKNYINNDEELVIANCDQIMEWSSKNFLHNVRLYDGAVVTYHTDTDKNSFAKLDKNGLVTEIREKEVISNISLNGIHYWKRGKYFVDSAESMIENQDRAPNGEFYIGPSYNYLIKQNYKIGIYHIPNEQHHPVGVPDDLERYLEHANKKY